MESLKFIYLLFYVGFCFSLPIDNNLISKIVAREYNDCPILNHKELTELINNYSYCDGILPEFDQQHVFHKEKALCLGFFDSIYRLCSSKEPIKVENSVVDSSNICPTFNSTLNSLKFVYKNKELTSWLTYLKEIFSKETTCNELCIEGGIVSGMCSATFNAFTAYKNSIPLDSVNSNIEKSEEKMTNPDKPIKSEEKPAIENGSVLVPSSVDEKTMIHTNNPGSNNPAPQNEETQNILGEKSPKEETKEEAKPDLTPSLQDSAKDKTEVDHNGDLTAPATAIKQKATSLTGKTSSPNDGVEKSPETKNEQPVEPKKEPPQPPLLDGQAEPEIPPQFPKELQPDSEAQNPKPLENDPVSEESDRLSQMEEQREEIKASDGNFDDPLIETKIASKAQMSEIPDSDDVKISDLASNDVPNTEKNIKTSSENQDMDIPQNSISISDHFVDAEDSNFFTYFIMMTGACIFAYVFFHNKNKILALALEGRKSRNPRGRGGRHSSASYSKLHSTLEEAIASNTTTPSSTHVLY